MRTAVMGLARVVLLAGPTALAFASGGFFDRPRLVAGIVAWALVAVAAATVPVPLPSSRPGRIALAGLELLTAWTALSLVWAPLPGPALDDSQRLVLYLGALIAASALLRDRRAARAVEPALAGGILVVVAYGLSERILPGAIELTRSFSAAGRLDQPLTYWNAVGALAALGIVLVARLAGDVTRPPAIRIIAAAAAAPLGAGLYLTLSRGALAAVAVGFIALVLLAPTRSQLHALALTLVAAALAGLAASLFGGVQDLSGSLGSREAQGAATGAILLALGLVAALIQAELLRSEQRTGLRELRLPRASGWIAAGTVVLLAGAFVAAAGNEGRPASSDPEIGSGAQRLSSVSTRRYSYWKVALRTAAHHPVAGVGSGGWRVEWLRERPVRAAASDAHSLYLETAAELGLVGLGLLGVLGSGLVLAAREARRRDPVLAPGPAALLAAWAFHAGLDWDWEMPALTLVALIVAGLLIAACDAPRAAPAGRSPASP